MTTRKDVFDVGSVADVARLRRLRVAIAALLFALVGMLAFEVPQAGAQNTCPPLTQGFWKNHPSAWKLNSLTLGTTSYTKDQALTILETPARGDASLILAHQLIAALLNIANGTDETPVSATIKDANNLLGAGPIPEGISPSSALGQGMVNDATILDNYNSGNVTTACAPVVPPGSCQPSSSLSALVSGTNVVSYVPKGAWSGGTTGVSLVNVENTSITPTVISTPNVVNSCASNPVSGQTVCTANNADVYVITGSTITNTLTSAGTGFNSFSGGICTNCGVAMDATHNKAVIGLHTSTGPGFQYLDLGTSPTFEPVFKSGSSAISEDPLIDPIRNFLLSPAETNNYEIVDVTTTTSPAFFENAISAPGGELDSAGEDCSTGIALAPAEFSFPSQVFIADLTQAVFTAGSPGSWMDVGSQVQTLSESFLSAGASGIAVAQGTHTGVVAGEFGGSAITAIVLPTTSGSGNPAISDWVTCSIPSFSAGVDPHTLTAYQSPSSGDAIGLFVNGPPPIELAVVDLTKMLNTTIVPRTVGGHGCASGTLPSTVVSFVSPVP